MTGATPATRMLAMTAALLGLASGVTAIWVGLAGVSSELARSSGGHGAVWMAGVALTLPVLAAAGAATARVALRLRDR
jgi:hypothetical protein